MGEEAKMSLLDLIVDILILVGHIQQHKENYGGEIITPKGKKLTRQELFYEHLKKQRSGKLHDLEQEKQNQK